MGQTNQITKQTKHSNRETILTTSFCSAARIVLWPRSSQKFRTTMESRSHQDTAKVPVTFEIALTKHYSSTLPLREPEWTLCSGKLKRINLCTSTFLARRDGDLNCRRHGNRKRGASGSSAVGESKECKAIQKIQMILKIYFC